MTAMTSRRAPVDNSETRSAAGSRNLSNALNAFLAAKYEIDHMLARIKTLSDDHFDTHPVEIHWGHVGTLNRYTGLLRQITDDAFKEGEHAE